MIGGNFEYLYKRQNLREKMTDAKLMTICLLMGIGCSRDEHYRQIVPCKYCKLIFQLADLERRWYHASGVSWSLWSGISLDVILVPGETMVTVPGGTNTDITNLEATSSLLGFRWRTLQFWYDPRARWYPHSFFGTNQVNACHQLL